MKQFLRYQRMMLSMPVWICLCFLYSCLRIIIKEKHYKPVNINKWVHMMKFGSQLHMLRLVWAGIFNVKCFLMLTQRHTLMFQLRFFLRLVINVNHLILNHQLALFSPTWLSNLHRNTGRSTSAINRPQGTSSPQIVGATWKSVIRKGRWLMENVPYHVACWALSAVWIQKKPEWISAPPFFFHPKENWKGRSNFGKNGNWTDALVGIQCAVHTFSYWFKLFLKAFTFFQLKWVVENKVQYFTRGVYQMVLTAWKHSSAICKVVFYS